MRNPAAPLHSHALAGCLYLPEESVENRTRTPLAIESVSIGDGQTNVPANASIEVRFNQPLDPMSLGDASMRLASGDLFVPADVRYDALTRTLVLDPRSDLRDGLWYTFTMDGFPLSIMGTACTGDTLEVRFRAGSSTIPPLTRPAVDFEDDVWPILRSCSCHTEETPFMEYVIAYPSAGEFLEASVGTPSHEWHGWLVVEPGRHETSYIIYKMLGDERLGMPTIMGESMPPRSPLPMEYVETIRDWIEQGAD